MACSVSGKYHSTPKWNYTTASEWPASALNTKTTWPSEGSDRFVLKEYGLMAKKETFSDRTILKGKIKIFDKK